MSTGIDLARAATHRIDWGWGKAPTLAQAVEALGDLVDKASKSERTELVAYLACQIIGERQRSDQNARLAVSQIRSIVAGYDKWASHADNPTQPGPSPREELDMQTSHTNDETGAGA